MDTPSPAAAKTAAADPRTMFLEELSTVVIGSVYARVERTRKCSTRSAVQHKANLLSGARAGQRHSQRKHEQTCRGIAL